MRQDLNLIFHNLGELREAKQNLESNIKELSSKEKNLSNFGKFRLQHEKESLKKVLTFLDFCKVNNKDFCYSLNGKPVNYEIINLLNK